MTRHPNHRLPTQAHATPLVALLAAVAAVAAPAAGQTPAAAGPATSAVAAVAAPAAAVAPDDSDGPAYPVSSFRVAYADPSVRGVPDAAVLLDEPIMLGETADGYVVPPSLAAIYRRQLFPDEVGAPPVRGGVTPVTRTLRGFGGATANFHASAIWAMNYQLVQRLNRRGLIGVYVNPDPKDVDDTGIDQRNGERADLGLVVNVGQVRAVRTVASGTRLPASAEKVDNPVHARIAARSPVRPGDVLNKDKIDDYVAGLNRFPGRRVDAAIAASGAAPTDDAAATTQPAAGGVALDYLVDERRPLTLYAQVANTGTRQTDEWRERLGLTYAQLDNRDDLLSLDYITAGFHDSHALLASYERPFGDADRLRGRVQAYYNSFTASDVGLGDFDFSGDEVGLSGELAMNVLQRRELFVDAFASARVAYYSVDNDALDDKGRATWFFPAVGLRAERATERASLAGQLALVGGVTGASHDDLDALGRTDADKAFWGVQLDVSHSFFLEPLLNPRGFNEQPQRQTLAHEVALSFRGLWIPNDRLIPQEQRIVGGFETVRGYDEALTAGDTTLVASAEYRLHVPRLFKVQEDPSKTPLFGHPFKFAPQYPLGRPDWDLVCRGFVDVGRVLVNDRSEFERDDTLVGAGVGVELVFRENVSVRLDYGVALTDAGDEDLGSHNDAGDSRLHVVATFTY